MITVAILINGQPILARAAVNKSEVNDKGETKYVTDSDEVIWHKRTDGAKVLAMKLLGTISEEV